MFKQLS